MRLTVMESSQYCAVILVVCGRTMQASNYRNLVPNLCIMSLATSVL